MDIKRIDKDFFRSLGFFVLMIFIVHTQYFQYAQKDIPHLISILGAIVLGSSLCGLLYFHISISDFATSELLFIMSFFIVSLFTGIVGSWGITNVSVHVTSWKSCFLYCCLIPAIMYILRSKRNIIEYVGFYSVFCIFCAFQLILHPVSSISNRYSFSLRLNVNILGLYFVFGCWCVLLIMTIYPQMEKIGILVLILFAYSITLTGSRKSLIALLLLVVPWFFFVWMKKKENPLLKIVGTIVVVVVFYYLYRHYYIGTELQNRMLDLSTQSDGSTLNRISMYEKCFDIFKSSPLFGAGFRAYGYLTGNVGGYSHATYSEIIASTGIVGTVLFLGMYINSILKIIRMLNITKNIEDLKQIRNILKLTLLFWVCIIFLSTCYVFIYELNGFIIFGVLFSAIRYCEWELESYDNYMISSEYY